MAYGTRAQFSRALHLPGLAIALDRLVRESDIVLLRAPGHPALVARILADARGVRHITKWAGFFGDFPGERRPARLERALARRSRWPVLIYGPSEQANLVSFPPALMSVAELRRARDLAARRTWEPPWRILCVGRLLNVKGFDLALRGLGRLRVLHPELPWVFTLIGDGPEADSLRRLAADAGIEDRIHFAGARSFEVVQEHYAEAHAVIMPGVVEGWPKIIAEAWAHAAVPVAASAGLVPWIMGDGRAGVAFEPTPDGLAAALHALLTSPERMHEMSDRGPERAAELSLESFTTRLVRVLENGCGLR
jgi:glycosyltransferase involved in cell wall biosynthesis